MDYLYKAPRNLNDFEVYGCLDRMSYLVCIYETRCRLYH